MFSFSLAHRTKKTHLYHLAYLSLATLATAHIALAEAPSAATTLDTVQVTAPIAKMTGTATKTDTPLREVPQSISIITAQDIQQRGLHGVEEVMWSIAGGQGGGYGPDSRSDWLLLRGFTPARYMDGLALMDGVWTGATRIEPYGMERVEALKGPASVNYGQMPPGGLLNYVSKRPQAVPLREIELRYGTYALKQAAFDLAGNLNDSTSLSYRLTGLARNSDTHVDFVHDDRYYLAPAFTWKAADTTELTVLARWQKADTRTGMGFLPPEGTLLPNPNGKIPRNVYTGEPNSNQYIKTLASLGYEFSHEFTNATVFKQNVRFIDSELKPNVVIGVFGLQADLRTANRTFFSTREKQKNWGIDNSVQWAISTGIGEHKLLTGLDYQYSKRNFASNFSFGAPPLDIFNPIYGTLPNIKPIFTDITQQHQEQLGIYAQDQIRWNNWLLTLGGRQDQVDTQTNGNKQRDHQFSGRVGLNYLFANGLTPYVLWSQSFQATVGNEHSSRGGHAFKPTTGEQVEAGIKYQPFTIDALITLSTYRIIQRNVLVVDPINTLFSIQQGQIHSRGMELETRWNIAPHFSIYNVYAYSNSQVTRTTDIAMLGKKIPLQPRHTASLGADYTLVSGLFSGLGLGLGIRYVGDHYGDSANLWHTPSYTLWDAALRYAVGYWQFSVNVQNLTDKDYISTCDSPWWCYYGYPRSVTASARYQW